MLLWLKRGNTPIPQVMRPQEFPNFYEMFVRDNTTAEDEGVYIVAPQLKTGTDINTFTHTKWRCGFCCDSTRYSHSFLSITLNVY